MGKWIAFVQIERFYIKAQRPPLWSGSRPLVVVHDGQVIEACRGAQAEGVNTGMPLQQVRCLCPQAQILTFSPDDCWPLYQQIWDIVAAHSPVVEPIDFHQGFADVSKVITDSHQATQWRNEVNKQIQQHTESEPSIGIGPNRFIARVAAVHNAVVGEEDAREFLAPIPLSDIDWLGSKLRDTLQRLGLTTLGQVVEVGKNMILQQAGPLGGQLYDWIKGTDNCVVQALYPPAEEEVRQVFDIEENQEVIIQVLGELCEQLADKLQDSGSQPRQITLRLETDTGSRTQTQQYSRPLKDAGQLYQRAQRLLEDLGQGQPLSSIELVVSDLQPIQPHQMDLWSSHQRRTVEQAIEAARSRYGMRAVSRASEFEGKRRFAQMILGVDRRFSW